MNYLIRCLTSKNRDIRRYGREILRYQFWGMVMDRFPRIYRMAEKLPIDTLPF